ncbi:MAG: 2Fe-2S iron-sulfur cluster-binding protein [Eggerthellaceae bacterium]|nr:2Fe-2S iron-sulfur cluster-binding protein [Eggerthellaceae bacterium]
MSNTLTITIDGRPCTCEPGEYLYDVAERNGIHIPALCRSDAFEDHRACCRVCLVEVEERGRRKVVTSCVYPVERECAVYTNSEKIIEERAVTLALLAKRAPSSDVIADMAREAGAAAGGAAGFDRLVTLDDEKCILCGLCVQACDSLGTGAISTVNRGVDKKVSTPYDEPSEDCIGCLSCANVCPTGAIEYTQDATSRTIWNRTFELAFCERCGAPMGTKAAVSRAAQQTGIEEPHVCDACRKKELADEMMRTYRYV